MKAGSHLVMFVLGATAIAVCGLIIGAVLIAHRIFEPHRQVEAGPHV